MTISISTNEREKMHLQPFEMKRSDVFKYLNKAEQFLAPSKDQNVIIIES